MFECTSGIEAIAGKVEVLAAGNLQIRVASRPLNHLDAAGPLRHLQIAAGHQMMLDAAGPWGGWTPPDIRGGWAQPGPWGDSPPPDITGGWPPLGK
jgi:hypothetical protein